MKKRKFKKFVAPTVYTLAAVALVLTTYLVEKNMSSDGFNDDGNLNYVSKTIFEDQIPVTASKDVVIRPYADSDVKTLKSYYNYLDEKEKQKSSLIYHDNTYLQNSGVDYGREKVFDVISIMDGTVLEVKEDQLLGKIVEVQHSNEVIGIYQSLSETALKKGDTVSQGDVIGKSGTANISKDLNNHLHFELYLRGQVVNPEDYFGKKLNEL